MWCRKYLALATTHDVKHGAEDYTASIADASKHFMLQCRLSLRPKTCKANCNPKPRKIRTINAKEASQHQHPLCSPPESSMCKLESCCMQKQIRPWWGLHVNRAPGLERTYYKVYVVSCLKFFPGGPLF